MRIRGHVANAVWTPDGSRTVYNSGNDIGSIAWDGSGDRLLYTDDAWPYPSSMTRDGRWVIYTTTRPQTRSDVWALDVTERKARPLLSASFNERLARLSPDDRWIAYVSDESGRDEVYVRSYPGCDGRYQVSLGGGTLPVWRPDGRELFFRRGDDVFVVQVRATAAGFDASRPPQRVPTAARNIRLDGRDDFDVAPDGRLLIQDNTPTPVASLNVVSGWLRSELANRLPPAR